MRKGLVVAAALVLLLPITVWARHPARRHAPGWTSAARWSTQKGPKPGPARAIGFYTAGCLEGAVSLPAAGPGFELLHLGRRRYFGHPALVEYVRHLAAAASSKHLPPLLVGDLSQPRGGPTPSDHGSHQSGLDVDIAYTRPQDALLRLLDPAERETVRFSSVVDLQSQTLNESWQPGIAELLELAASDPAVDRVFVNPVIKRELCEKRAHDEPWLARLRPWWRHDDHFHVRLKCPERSADCRPQAPVPSGDGCEELAWWFSHEARAAAEQRRRIPAPQAAKPRRLPARCRQVLQ